MTLVSTQEFGKKRRIVARRSESGVDARSGVPEEAEA
jgi:hypothetical protein